MNEFTVALDMDSTVYDLHAPWLKWLKDTHMEAVAPHEILTWDWHNQLNCGQAVYDFLHLDDAFLNAPLFPGAHAAIMEVHNMGVRQCFVSTVKTKTGAWQKQQAIIRDFPELKDDVFITSHNKDLVRADLLVDDGPHNLKMFQRHGWTCKVPYTYNKDVETDFVLFDWSQYSSIVEDVLKMCGR